MIRTWVPWLGMWLLIPVCSAAAQKAAATPPPASQQDDAVLPGDWAPELLDGIISGAGPEARESLLDAAFAAGPAIIPQLEAALKDDRTAEFGAQSLAYIGGPKSFGILSKLVSDPRDLDLRRFFLGALGEYQTPEVTQYLMNAVKRSDAEPDRTVTEAAILALTVRSDASLVAPLRQAESSITDVVIHDDLDNALDVIGARAKYLATPEGKAAGISLQRAVRTYFIPALEPAAPPTPSSHPARSNAKPAGTKATQAPPHKPDASVEIKRLAFSPDKSRALAHVVLEFPTALAAYDIILQKRMGDWNIASVWLGEEKEK